MTWQIEPARKLPSLKGAIMIAGLPGIGSVGKIVSDFLITETGAVKLADLFSYFMPNSVFVQENNLIDLPKISFYYKESGGTKLLILTGDTQPTTDRGTYLFCEYVLDFFEKHKCKEIITLGGIGLSEIPKAPKVYCTGNSKEMVEIYTEGTDIDTKVYGVVGPIMGVSGLMLGLASRRKIGAISFLAETYGHPMYLGLTAGRELLKVLDARFLLDLNLKNLNKEIKEMEGKMKRAEELVKKSGKKEDVSYIG